MNVKTQARIKVHKLLKEKELAREWEKGDE